MKPTSIITVEKTELHSKELVAVKYMYWPGKRTLNVLHNGKLKRRYIGRLARANFNKLK